MIKKYAVSWCKFNLKTWKKHPHPKIAQENAANLSKYFLRENILNLHQQRKYSLKCTNATSKFFSIHSMEDFILANCIPAKFCIPDRGQIRQVCLYLFFPRKPLDDPLASQQSS